jgi:hypothetical protein
LNATEQSLRRGLGTLAGEAAIVTDYRGERPKRDWRPYAMPTLAIAVTATLVIAVFLLRGGSPSVDNAPATDSTKHFALDKFDAYPPWGILLRVYLTSDTPTTITDASLDSHTTESGDGDLWDPTLPDPDVGFDHVDLVPSKQMSIEFTFLPHCGQDIDWDHVTINAEATTGQFSQAIATPGLADVVSDWCQAPIDVRTGSGHASANWCEVTRDFEFTNPSGRAVTITLATPGWTADPLVLSNGQYEGTMVIQSDQACDLPDTGTDFLATYSDGSTDQIRGPRPLQDM